MPTVLIVFALLGALSQQPPPRAVEIHGQVTSADGTIRLPGAVIDIVDTRGETILTVFSDDRGSFRAQLLSGTYALTVRLDGFREHTVSATLTEPVNTVHVRLEILGVTERADARVVLGPSVATDAGQVSALHTAVLDQFPLRADTIESGLTLFAGVVATPAGVSIKGAWRTGQATQLLGLADLADPATRNTPFTPPVSAMSTAALASNPYNAESGGFSAAATVLDSRRAANLWRLTFANLIPSLRYSRSGFGIEGVRAYSPRYTLGGPIADDRVWLISSGQAVYRTDDVPERPADDVITHRELRGFHRADVAVTPLVRTALSYGGFAQDFERYRLSALTPPDATAIVQPRSHVVNSTWTFTPSDRTVFESTVQFTRHRVRTDPYGAGALQLHPFGERGNYFSAQTRAANQLAWSGTVTRLATGRGEHLARAGVRLQRATMETTFDNRPVEIWDAAGRLIDRFTFAPPATVRGRATSLGVFVQDRWSVKRGLVLEGGVRLDVDGALGDTIVAPRAGVVLALNQRGTLIVRGGGGWYAEQAPLLASVFEQLPQRSTAAGPLTHVLDGDLRTPLARSYNVGAEYQVTPTLFLRANHLERRGRDELIVDAARQGTAGTLVLASAGRSRYHETEFTLRYYENPRLDVSASYTFTASVADLNDLVRFFGTASEPLIRPNAQAPTPADVPHRFLAWMRYQPSPVWQISPILEIRSGTPYSVVNQHQAFVGAPNGERFPWVRSLDVLAERRIRVGRSRPWLGVRVTNALGAFIPREVQGNIDAADFGQFYWAEGRRFGVSLRM